MPGIPKSKRCQRCKQRKIKCDEKWPVCTPCARAESACSGPPTMVKFVHNGRHSSTATKKVAVTESSDNTKGEVVQTRQRGTFVNLGSRHMPEGSTYQSMRLVERLRPGPTTTADRLAVRLVGYFDRGPSRDPSVVLTYFKLLPQRLDQSAALRDSIALFCSCWSNFQRGVPGGHFMDYNLYGKSLRSLQRALNDPTEQLSCETLAATTILDRTEIFFDAKRSYKKAVHVAGIVALLIKRGPPKLNDDLDIHLALENQGRLISTWVVEGGKNPYVSPAWRERLTQAVKKKIDPPCRLAEAYQLESYVSRWPEMIQDMRLLRSDPSKTSREDRALNIHERATRLAAEVKLLGEELLEKARQSKQMVEVADPAAIPGVKYEFNNPQPLQVLMVYVAISIILNRILFNVAPCLGFSDSLLDIEHKYLCRQILLSLSHIEGRGPICAYSYSSQIMLAVEGLYGAERTHILDFLRKTDIHKGKLPPDPCELEKFAIETSRSIAGQGTFVRCAIT